jgi:peptidoglycan/LPS O-acetylase OafA/YrhL
MTTLLPAAGRPTIPRLPALDGIRIVAATAVVLQHVGYSSGATTGKSYGGWLSAMDFAVALFFVLSGFVLFQPWARAAVRGGSRPTTGRFLFRRYARILPGYWVAVTACLIVLPTTGVAPLGDWLRQFSLSQIYTFEAIRRGLGQTWTLCVEASFYPVLIVLGALVIGRRGTWRPNRSAVRIALLAVAVTGTWVALLATGVLKLYLHILWLPAYLLWFGAGMVLCTAYVALSTGTAPRSWQVLQRLAAAPLACWGVALGLLAVATTPVVGPRGLAAPTAGQFAAQLLLYLVIAVMVLVPLVFGPPTTARTVVGSRPMRWLGTLSYSLFLWHPFVLEMVYEVTGYEIFKGHLLEVFALTMAGGLTLAVLSYYLVERPLIRIASDFPRGRRPSTVETQSAPSPATATA